MPKSLLEAKGSGAIPMTPFTEDDQIDVPVLEKEIEFMVESKVGCICSPLMVSEFMSLSEEERKLMIQIPAEVNAGRRIFLANIAAPDVHTAISYALFAEKMGADGIIAMPPYIGNWDKQGFLDYYAKIADTVDLPIMIQNHSTAPLTSPELVELCAKYKNISWVKQEIAPGPESIADLMSVRTPDIVGVMSGFGALYSPLDFALGATATIHACEICDLVQKEWDLLFAGKDEEAREYHNKIHPVLELESLLGMAFSKEIMIRRGIFKNRIIRNKSVDLQPYALQEIDRVWKTIEPMLIWQG